MKKIVLMIAACGLSLASSVANASVTVDSTSFDRYDVANTDSAYTSISYGDAGLDRTFSEFLTFTSTLGGIYNIDASSASPFTKFTSGVLTSGGDTVATLSPVVQDETSYWRVTNVSLGAGQYTLTLDGMVSGSQSPGVLSGTISIRELASGAPEPATWAMMLLGFGVVGYAARKRRRQSARVRYHFAAA